MIGSDPCNTRRRAGGRRAARSTTRRVLAVCVLAAAALLGGALPASAHAVLTGSDPVGGAALDSAPARVTLRYSESVSVESDSIRVLDATGARVDEGGASSGAGASEATVALRAGLGPGTYVVSWRVVSADSHPVGGAFAFGVGGPPDAGAAAALPSGGGGSRAVGVTLGTARFAAFLGAVLLIGVTFFVTALWPAGLRRSGPVRLIAAGWVASLVGAAGMLLLQGPYTAATGLSGVVRWDPLAATLDDRYGQLLAIRILALLLSVPLLRRLVRDGPPAGDPAGEPPVPVGAGRGGPVGQGPQGPDGPAAGAGHADRWSGHHLTGPGRWGLVELGGLGLVLAMTIAMIGHAGAGDLVWLATASLTLHTLAMAVWLGGLCVLGLTLLGWGWRVGVERPGGASRPVGAVGMAGAGAAAGAPAGIAGTPGDEPIEPARSVELARVLPRWSRTATAAIAAIVVTGTYQAWREVGAFGALFDTTYGRLLLYKLWFVLGALGLGLLAQRWVRRHYRPIVRALAATEDTVPAGDAAAGAGPAGAPPAGSMPAGSAAAGGGPVNPPVTAFALAGLRRGVVFEILVAVVVLGVTAVLVNTIPGRDSYAPPFAQTAIAGPLTVDVEVSPTRTGAQIMHIYTYDPRGRPQKLVEARGELTLPAAGVGPLEVPLVEVTPGHAVAEGVGVPLPGEWQLRFTLRINDFDQYVTTLFYEVR